MTNTTTEVIEFNHIEFAEQVDGIELYRND
jgi:hypothetical protein